MKKRGKQKVATAAVVDTPVAADNGSPVTPPPPMIIDPPKIIENLLVRLFQTRCGLPTEKWKALINRQAGIALNSPEDNESTKAFLAVLEAEKVDMASAKMLLDRLNVNGNGGATPLGAVQNTIVITNDDLIEGTARLLDGRGTGATEESDGGPNGEQGDSDVNGPALAGTVAFDD